MKHRYFRYLLISVCLLTLLSCATGPDRVLLRNQGEASRNLAEAYMADGNFTSALRELLKAEPMIPDDPFLHNDLGLVYMAKNRHDLAIESFKKSIALNPDFIPACNNLGTAYLAQQEWDTAIEVFKELSGNLLYGTPHYPLSNLGWAYYNKKDYRLAEKYYLEALRIEPKFIIAMRGLAKTYIGMGKISEAIAKLEKAVTLAPQVPELYFDLGEAYTLAGDIQKALTAFNKVYELSPGSTLADAALERIRYLQ